MALFAGVGELYLISTGIGSIYLVTSFLLGHTHTGGTAHGPGHAPATHAGGHTHAPAASAPGHGTDIASGHSAATPGHGGGHSGSTSHGHTSAESSQSSVNQSASTGSSVHNLAHVHAEFHGLTGQHHAVGQAFDTGPVQALPRLPRRYVRLLLTILSPMTMAIFLAFFGLSGIISIVACPWLSVWSIIPALLFAIIVTRISLSAMAWMTMKLNVSNVARSSDLIGLQGKVLIPIEPDETGQITFAVKGIRRKSAARAMRPDINLAAGQRIIIVDMTDKVAIVEPWSDGPFGESPEIIELLPEQLKTESKE